MKQVAEATGGTFYRATDTQSLRDVYADIDRFEKTTRTIKGFTRARRAVRVVRDARSLSRARRARPVRDALPSSALLDSLENDHAISPNPTGSWQVSSP